MITIMDYKAGNIVSVKRALDHLGIPNRISDKPEDILRAERLIFPGVGHAASAMEELRRSGLGDALKQAHAEGTPILGVCLGCQIILTHSEEGDTACLDLIPGSTRRFVLDTVRHKVPHMGWNEIQEVRCHPVLEGCGREFYFVHSYYICPEDEDTIVALCDHGIAFPAVIAKDNLVAAQFHPEKSGEDGLRVLRNFYAWEGR
jgi:glutamine amidotransferase